MELYERVENIKSREDLIKFINYFRKDLQSNGAEWKNVTLADYLEAMEAWVTDMDGII